MNINGIIIGAAVFLSIGICHPLVIKMAFGSHYPPRFASAAPIRGISHLLCGPFVTF